MDTTADARDVATARIRRARNGRRLFAVVITIFLLLAVADVFGVRTRTIADADASLSYAQVSRRGLDAPWTLDVHRDGGFADQIEVRISSSYLDAVQVQDIQPEPTSSTVDGDMIVWQFDPPKGDSLHVALTDQVDPHEEPGRKVATTSVRVGDEELATFTYRTWVVP